MDPESIPRVIRPDPIVPEGTYVEFATGQHAGKRGVYHLDYLGNYWHVVSGPCRAGNYLFAMVKDAEIRPVTPEFVAGPIPSERRW